MSITRRDLIKTTGISLLALITQNFLWRSVASAGHFFSNSFSRLRSGENLFLAFNNIKNPENGESDEFTTIRNINNILNQMNVRNGTAIIGIGARTGSPADPYGTPGEMGYLWKKGEPWTGKVTHIKDARPVPLLVDFKKCQVLIRAGRQHESGPGTYLAHGS